MARPPPSSSPRGLPAKLSSGGAGRGADGASCGAAAAVPPVGATRGRNDGGTSKRFCPNSVMTSRLRTVRPTYEHASLQSSSFKIQQGNKQLVIAMRIKPGDRRNTSG
jgi:hypothetical protein